MKLPHCLLIDNLIDAFNKGNVDQMISYFGEDVKYFEHPSKILMRNQVEILAYYRELFFQYPLCQVEVLQRTLISSNVIDHQRMRLHPEEVPFDRVIIYKLVDNLMVRIDIIR